MNSLILVGETGETHILDALLSCCWWTKKSLPRCFCLFTFSSLAMSFPASCKPDPRKIPYTEVCQVDMGITFRNVSHLKFPRPMGYPMLQMHCLMLYMCIYIYIYLLYIYIIILYIYISPYLSEDRRVHRRCLVALLLALPQRFRARPVLRGAALAAATGAVRPHARGPGADRGDDGDDGDGHGDGDGTSNSLF